MEKTPHSAEEAIVKERRECRMWVVVCGCVSGSVLVKDSGMCGHKRYGIIFFSI